VKAKKVKKASAADDARRRADDDNDTNPYGVTHDDLDVARCPHCADVLDPPDTKVCLTCGYDLLARRRHESRKVWAPTFGDYAKHHLPAVGLLLVAAAFITLIVFIFLGYTGEAFREIGLENEQEDPVTKKKGFVVPPGACGLPVVVLSLFIVYKSGWFAIKRFFINWRPPENIKKT
jgi:hypothetical protein